MRKKRKWIGRLEGSKQYSNCTFVSYRRRSPVYPDIKLERPYLDIICSQILLNGDQSLKYHIFWISHEGGPDKRWTTPNTNHDYTTIMMLPVGVSTRKKKYNQKFNSYPADT